MRLMSFAATTPQMRDRSKTVTRRLGWKHAKVGDRALAVEKARGVRREDRVELGVIEFTGVRREHLEEMPRDDVAREGFPGKSIAWFVGMFCRLNRCNSANVVTRIAFRFVEGTS